MANEIKDLGKVLTELETKRDFDKIENDPSLVRASSLIEEALRELGFYRKVDLESNSHTYLKDPSHYQKTPFRIAKAWKEFIDNILSDTEVRYKANVTIFEDFTIDELISVVNIPFSSLCIHHFFPFSGYVDIAYLPNGKILGLSKFPRLVKIKCAKPTIQEILSKELVDLFNRILSPKFIMVMVTGVHTCCSCRGINTEVPMIYSSIRYDKEFVKDEEVDGLKSEAISLFKRARQAMRR